MAQAKGPTRKELVDEAKRLKIRHPVNIPKLELEKLIAAARLLPAELPMDMPAPPAVTPDRGPTAATETDPPVSPETPAEASGAATVIKLPTRAQRRPRRRLSDRERRPWDPTAGYG